ncbi:hydroxymethylglutaryl-CoA lyase, partial [Xylella fastidiosa subsp. multiplex]|nr:hydroxymethylglutaryl-CoA lyase [Xylella fastidiosa subsp. multiplex]
VATSAWMAEQLGRPSPSRTVSALSHKDSEADQAAEAPEEQ